MGKFLIRNGVLEDLDRKLKVVKIPDGVERISRQAFLYKGNVEKVIIPSSVKIIDANTFSNLDNLEEVILSHSITTIEEGTFSNCQKLKKVILPSNLGEIGRNAFRLCISLSNIDLPIGVKEIGSEAFYGCKNLLSVDLPYSLKELGDRAFSYCTSLKSAFLPSLLTELKDSLFYGCSSLMEVNIPESVKKIGTMTFWGCSQLKNVVISNGLSEIGINAFKSCDLAKFVIINNEKAGMLFSEVNFNYLGLKKGTSVEVYRNEENTLVNEVKTTLKRSNLYNFTNNKVSEEDILKSAILSDVPVFIHGKSSDGKSARVKQLDPDCEIIYLRNATPDSLNGKSVYKQDTGEMIDIQPTWYQKLVKKCKDEPNKIHILFFDELTNALPSLQGMAFNIVLDREVNGKWKLPNNCRIVASGNELKDSLSANTLVEPLFNRFAHIYIETTVESWLKWATSCDKTPQKLDLPNNVQTKKIHPAVFGFIAHRRENVLRTEYTGEKPNADPRKWELASKILYQTKNPLMIRALVGEEIAYEFAEFCQKQAFTLDDILNKKYDCSMLKELTTAEKYATTMGLCYVDTNYVESVRQFIKNFGNEFVAIFDSYWINGDENRINYIMELKLKEKNEEKTENYTNEF